MRTEADQGVVVVRPLPKSASELRTVPDIRQPINPGSQHPIYPEVDGGRKVDWKGAGGALSGLLTGGGRLDNQQTPRAGASSSVQQWAKPAVYIFTVGEALRAGFSIPCPTLESVNGVPVRACNRLDRGEGFALKIVGNAGAPVVRARWVLRYVVDGDLPPKPLPVLPNPMMSGQRMWRSAETIYP